MNFRTLKKEDLKVKKLNLKYFILNNNKNKLLNGKFYKIGQLVLKLVGEGHKLDNCI